MKNILIMNSTESETRVAILEENTPVELYLERKSEKGITGNIYKGRVMKVLKGMQSAFVDIGLEKAAFLYVTDVSEEFAGLDYPLDENNNDNNKENKGKNSIEQMLREGQEIVTQVVKEPLGTKGARISSHVSLPGRNLVLMPTINHVGISKKIEDDDERKRLKEVLSNVKPKDFGVIVRTACEGKSVKSIKNDIAYLSKIWKNILRRYKLVKSPYLLYQDIDLTIKTIRDLVNEETEKVYIDSKETYKNIIQFIDKFVSDIDSDKIVHYDEKEPIFDHFGIEREMEKALTNKVWLKSGGYIIIEETEALVAIDVNTGKYVGRGNFEDTIFKINIEAARAIAYQLRLRNIGGLIVIDFIDMAYQHNRERLYDELVNELKKDRAKCTLLPISDLGLLQMTRKRTRETLNKYLTEACSCCNGRGFLKSKKAVCYEIIRKLRGMKQETEPISIYAHPSIIEMLGQEEMESMQKVEKRLKRVIFVHPKMEFAQSHYEIMEG